MTVTIYHNPRCSKSRQTLQLLEQNNIEPKIVEYLKEVPDADTIASILALLGIQPRDLMRKKEAEYQELGLDNPDLTDQQLIEAMVHTPKLIERPIVIKDGKAAIGRPPETILDIL
ncbi:MAG: arsenate reductase (glutaredoxin) [Gammaproteobacteria bacterium]|nr:arsenate reductase (glutaredoxin) [Gammaproteobacteria bacterium]